MTRRERIEARLQKRREWAESRERMSDAAFSQGRSLLDGIPLGQPILVGHHSEKRHRRQVARAAAAMDRGCESAKMAAHHESKAAGIADQLDRSIYSDDPDAPERIAERIAELEAKRERNTAENKAYRKAPGANPAAKLAACVEAGTMTREAALDAARLFATCHWEKQPHPAYENANLGGNISRLRKRLEDVRRLRERAARAEAAGGVCVESNDHGDAQVTFTEYPGRAMVDSLKAAGFHWSGGSWFGKLANLPEGVQS